jgi:hypothetical protein
MHGNVSELCRDAWVNSLPGGENPEVSEGYFRMSRGGVHINSRDGAIYIPAAGFQGFVDSRYVPQKVACTTSSGSGASSNSLNSACTVNGC